MEIKILIVDDEPSAIKLVDTLLESFGYKSYFIPKADYLMKTLDADIFDLILMDINMPGIDGITSLRNLKMTRHKDIPVIMLTADTNEETLENCFSSGAADYLTKPIQELVLKSRVKAVIEKQQAERKIKEQRDKLAIANDQLCIKNKHIHDSLCYAKLIQDALLPNKRLIENCFPDSFIFFKPKDIVSGDFYWFHKENTHSFFAVGDCTGHGVPGAFMSMIGITLLNEITKEKRILTPAKILSELNVGIINTFNQQWKNKESESEGDGMDISLFAFDETTNKLTVAMANHTMFLITDDKINTVDGNIFSIGGFFGNLPNTHYTDFEFNILNETCIYFFSDGIKDQFNEKDEKFGELRLKNLITSIYKYPSTEQHGLIKQAYKDWRGSTHQTDDILVAGIKLEHTKNTKITTDNEFEF